MWDKSGAKESAPPKRPAAVTYGSPDAAKEALQQVVSALLDRSVDGDLWVLEAGAGKRIRLDVPVDAYIVGVDTDSTAMDLNPRLNERIVGDLHDYTAKPASFDLITCWYVLEHVDQPEILLDRFAEWITPGGLVALAVPHLKSPKALVTKLTPHGFHVWFRRMLGYPNAGKPGYGPYPTTLRPAIAPQAMAALVAPHGLRPVFEGFFEDAKQVAFRRKLRLTGWRWRAVNAVAKGLTRGTLDAVRSEYLVIFQREPAVVRHQAATSGAALVAGQ